jgi:hypothetical protein
MEITEKEKLEKDIRERIQTEEKKRADDAIAADRKRSSELSTYVEKFGHIKGVKEAVKDAAQAVKAGASAVKEAAQATKQAVEKK